MPNKSMQSPLAKARGLGSSHHGTGHKIAHNITTLTNIPLVAWVMYTVFSLKNSGYEEFVTWMSHPVSMVVAILFVVSAFKHFALELQVVFEDYISNYSLRMLKVIGMKLAFLTLGTATIVSILKISFTASVL